MPIFRLTRGVLKKKYACTVVGMLVPHFCNRRRILCKATDRRCWLRTFRHTMQEPFAVICHRMLLCQLLLVSTSPRLSRCACNRVGWPVEVDQTPPAVLSLPLFALGWYLMEVAPSLQFESFQFAILSMQGIAALRVKLSGLPASTPDDFGIINKTTGGEINVPTDVNGIVFSRTPAQVLHSSVGHMYAMSFIASPLQTF